MRRGTDVELRSYRSALDRTGDVLVGTHARRSRRRRILLAVLGVLLMVGAVGVYYLMYPWGRHDPGPGGLIVRCTVCGHEQRLAPDARRTYPVPCSACNERAAWPVWQCRNCGHRFLPADTTSGFVRCPRCGSTSVGAPQDDAQTDSD